MASPRAGGIGGSWNLTSSSPAGTVANREAAQRRPENHRWIWGAKGLSFFPFFEEVSGGLSIAVQITPLGMAVIGVPV